VCIGSKTVDAQSLHIELQRPDTLNSIDDEKDVVVATLLAEGGKIIAKPREELHRAHTQHTRAGVDGSGEVLNPQPSIPFGDRSNGHPSICETEPRIHIRRKLTFGNYDGISGTPTDTKGDSDQTVCRVLEKCHLITVGPEQLCGATARLRVIRMPRLDVCQSMVSHICKVSFHRSLDGT
jgi:hypothetical protein